MKYAESIDALKAKLSESIALPALALEIDKILASFKDGHTGVEGAERPAGYLPFLVAETTEGVVAYLPGDGCFRKEHPFIRSIDGVEIAKWLEAAGRISTIETRRHRTMSHVRCVRKALGPAEDAPLKVVLASASGSTDTVEGPLSPLRLPHEDRRFGESRILGGNVGYLRLAQMNDEAVEEVRRRMGEFRGTDALVIDVRGNGGGSRAALREIFP